MAVNAELIRERMKITFGKESQTKIGEKLNMTQGNVSKMLSGADNQLPSLETICLVAEKYNVSVDWLLGFSEEMCIPSQVSKNSYADIVRAISSLYDQKSIEIKIENAPESVNILIEDSILGHLLEICQKLGSADIEALHTWVDTKLPRFDLPVLSSRDWTSDAVHLADDAETEEEWLKVYERVKNHQTAYNFSWTRNRSES